MRLDLSIWWHGELWERSWDCPDYIYNIILEVCKDYGVPYQLVLAIDAYESNYNPTAVGYNPPSDACPYGSRDMGLSQINDCYHPSFDVSNYADPAYNTRFACDIILSRFARSHDWYDAIQPWASRDRGWWNGVLGPGAWLTYKEWTKVPIYSCPYCPMTFESEGEMRQHIAMVHGIEPPMPEWVLPASLSMMIAGSMVFF